MHGAPKEHGYRRRSLVNPTTQNPSIPRDLVCAKRERVGPTAHGVMWILGERPSAKAATVESHIHRTMIVGPVAIAKVKWREHATQERNEGDGVAPIIAQSIDVPPRVATRSDRRVEDRSCSRLAAARRPERAAIGTPGPG